MARKQTLSTTGSSYQAQAMGDSRVVRQFSGFKLTGNEYHAACDHASNSSKSIQCHCEGGLGSVQHQPYSHTLSRYCLLYTSDAADEEDSVDLGGRRIIKKKKKKEKRKGGKIVETKMCT
eukprot:TRINITY_DN869_c0_g1_i17.p1 TRINITY_DN869_c0_g1~~TRINITY_DN869_c0_g1_i17.p1  ORF type:complete len:120 (+),score=14.97 TRINITY_DN869_c0_g1_i17:482-841(+)